MQTISNLFPIRLHTSINQTVLNEQMEKIKSNLRFQNAVGFTWLLREELTVLTEDIVNIKALIYSEEYYYN